MSVLEAIVLGIAQGLTEFLPISSSGHLRILPAFFGWEDPGAAFTAVTQLGTMTAVLVYFWSDLLRIYRSWGRSVLARDWWPADRDARLGWYILIGTIPIGIFGLAFKDHIETSARDLYLIASALIVLGLLLLAAEKAGRRERDMEHLSLRDGIVVGFAQSLALIPGVSRSGATITAGLFLGLDRPTAARFSFLLSIPAVVLSGALEFGSLVSGEEGGDATIADVALATVLAFVSGYAAIAFLLRYLQTHTTFVFVVYRIALGSLVFALLAAGAIE